jgi:hypothetical protein
VHKEKHNFRGSIPLPLMSKGKSCRHGEYCNKGENSFYAWWIMCFFAGFPSITKGEIVSSIVIDVKGNNTQAVINIKAVIYKS